MIDDEMIVEQELPSKDTPDAHDLANAVVIVTTSIPPDASEDHPGG